MNQPNPGSIIMAVDGGGSKTDGVALDADGRVLAQARRPGSSPHMLELGPAVHVVDSLVTELRASTGGRPVGQANVYISGLDLPIEVSEFTEKLAALPWARELAATGGLVVDNDMFALLRAGTAKRDAVAVVCGTGINCIGVREDGRRARFAALGAISGDWGGGSGLGQQALWHAAREADGRGGRTSLTASVPAFLDLPDVQAVIEAFHFGRLSSDVFAQLAPLVLEASDQGDEVANSILDRQAEEIVDFAVAAITRLELDGQKVPVVLGGGVLATGNARLVTGIEQRLAVRAPGAEAILVQSRPILGGALLALESAGAPATALSLAREALTAPPAPAVGQRQEPAPGALRATFGT